MSSSQVKLRKRKRSVGGIKQWGPALLLISPSLVLVGFFVYGLIGTNIYTSMLDNHTAGQLNGAEPVHFVGLDNFIALFKNQDFLWSFRNLIIFTVVFLLGTLILGFLWAWLLELPLKGDGIFRSVYMFPMAVSFIASGVVWRWLLNSGQGADASGLNRLFQSLGLGFLQNSWIASQKWAIIAIAVPAIWQLSGYIMALFLAGFRGIPDELREAARIDGANEWQLYKNIIFPQLTPVALSAVIIIGHMSLKSFDLIMAIADKNWYQTFVPAIDMYNAMTVNDHSRAAAIGTVLLLVVAALVIPYLIHDAKGQNKR
ncbi:MAG: sugar ABC transporter permease [Winkia neuii]|uniref:carbohydrate ABC transporter permease n=1 Tax=Winkia neuii TaxID=33007 RepID=UPI0029112139|nr:sugar ABC transporter permease [Winkia neuii]MDU5161690.1 sugar ABC transporter permease [Winkia neuii]